MTKKTPAEARLYGILDLGFPGHGALTDRSGIRALIDLFLTQSQRARDAVKAGQYREDFIKAPTTEYADFAAADWIRPITLGGLYDEAKTFTP